jgi:hypothetical protein
MAKFPYKTQHQLQVYFQSLELAQLTDLNHQYGDHFTNLEAKLDDVERQLGLAEQRIQTTLLNRQKLDEQIPFLAAQDEQYHQNRESISDTSSRSERYLAYQAVNASPSEIHSRSSSELSASHVRLLAVKEGLNDQLNRLKSSKSRAIEELKLLNRVIDYKRQQEISQEAQLSHSLS